MRSIKFTQYLLPLFIVLLFAGCKKEPVEPTQDPNGTNNGTTNVDPVGNWFNEPEFGFFYNNIKICSSGTFNWVYGETAGSVISDETGTWSISGNILTMNFSTETKTYNVTRYYDTANSTEVIELYNENAGSIETFYIGSQDPCDFVGSGGSGGGGGGGGGGGPVYGAPISDNDGNTYQTVVIGNQTWMAENMKTTKTASGQSIPLGFTHYTSPMYPSQNDVLAMTWKNHDPGQKDVYGGLYNYYTAQRICPNGWHLPTKQDWVTLANYVGTSNAYALQKSGSWPYSTTNETGFSALPNEYIYNNGGSVLFGTQANYGRWWSDYVDGTIDAYGFSGYDGQGLTTYNTPVYHATIFLIAGGSSFTDNQRFQGEGLPCRCVMD